MTQRRFPAVEALIRHANRLAPDKLHPVDGLTTMIRLLAENGTDPHVLAGALLEGAVETLVQHVPAEGRHDAARAMRDLLSQRLSAHGL